MNMINGELGFVKSDVHWAMAVKSDGTALFTNEPILPGELNEVKTRVAILMVINSNGENLF